MALIEVRDLSRVYGGRVVLKDINLRVERGETLALIGPTGAGKTTLLRLIDRLDTPSSGRIYFDGEDVTEGGRVGLALRRRMAFVLQKPVVFNASVYDNIACGLRWRKGKRGDIRQKVTAMLARVGLADYRERNARDLSGGEVQRVAIARAMAVAPEVLLLDEPTANLDPVSVTKVEELIKDFRRESTTIVMATHDMPQGQRLADRVGVLVGGELRQLGRGGEVFYLPRNRAVAELVGVENIMDGKVVASEGGIIAVDVGGGVIEVVAAGDLGDGVEVGIRPENITLTLAEVSSSARNTFSGEIIRMVDEGALVRVDMDCGFRLVALVTQRSAAELKLEVGKQVHASFKATGVHVMGRDD